jgi:hypothetical protein
MIRSFLMILIFISFLVSGASSCNQEDDNINTENTTPMVNGKIKITVNSQTFTATLLDNNSAKAFKEMLPMTINMIELNGNEKYSYSYTKLGSIDDVTGLTAALGSGNVTITFEVG